MGKSKKSQSKDPVFVEEEEVTVGPETFHKSLEELKKALSILGFEITPKKKPLTEKIASPIADVINESRKRKLSTGSNTEAESSEPHPKRHKHGKHRHHKNKGEGDGSGTKLPATITSPEVENCIEKTIPICSTPVSSGAKSAKRAVLEGAPVSATIASSETSESDNFSLVKMSPLNDSKYLKKHKKDAESEESPIASKKSPKKKHKTKNYNEQTTQPNSKPASKEKVSQKNVLQSGLGGDWTRQEIASGDAKKLALLEKYFSGEKGAKKQEIKEKKDENKSTGKPSPSNKQTVIGKSNQPDGNTSEKHMGKGIIKAGQKINKPSKKIMGSDKNSGDAHSTPNHNGSIKKNEELKRISGSKASPAKKLKMDTETKKLKNTKFPTDGKTAKEHSPKDNQQVPLAQETVSEKRKKAKKQKKGDTTPSFDGNNKHLDISKHKETSDDFQSSLSTNNDLEPSKISSKKKKKKKHTKKSKKREKKKIKKLKETSKSKKVNFSESGTQTITFQAQSSIILSESPSKKTKKPNEKVKPVASSISKSPQKNRSLSSITPEISKVGKVKEDKKQTVKSKNENSSKAGKGKKSLSSQDIPQITSQIKSKHDVADKIMACEPSEKKSKKKQKTVENTKTNNNQVNIDVLKQTSTAKVGGKSVKKLVSGNLKSEVQKSKAPQQNKECTLPKDCKTAKKTLTSPLKKTQKSSNVKGNVKSKKPVGDDELFSKSFDFDAWEEKMKMIELLKSGGKLEKNESEVPAPSFEESPPASRDKKKKKKKKSKH